MTTEERPCGVERTLVLLDADLPPFALFDAALSINKTSQSLAIEAVTEYSRIFFDLFPAAYLCVCVGAVAAISNEPQLQRLNLWAPQRQQSLQRITERFPGMHFVGAKVEKVAEEGEVVENLTSLEASLRKAMGVLTEGEEKRLTPLRTRVVCFTGQRSKEEDTSLIKAAAESLRSVSGVVLCDLVLVSLSAKATALKRANQVPKAVNPALSVLRHECTLEQVPQFAVQLARDHFGLRQLKVSGIPMKDPNVKEGERLISTVRILHPSVTHSPLAPDAFASGGASERVLHWRTVDKKLALQSLPSYCIHRVTPLQPFSAAAVCLFRHLHASKPVLLAPSENTSVAPTHLLLLNGGEVWLHCLHCTPLEPLPAAALAAYGRRATDYRIESFTQLINSNTLYPPPAKKKNRSMLSSYFRTIPTAQLLAAAAVPANPKALVPPSLAQLEPASTPYPTTKNMERTTRYYPLFETDTLLCAHEQAQSPALCSFVDPLRSTLMSEASDEVQTAQTIEMLSRLQQYAVQNEPSLFPPLVNNLVARQEAYKRLWLELLVMARRSQRLNAVGNHGKIVTAMERMWPEINGLPPEVKDEEKEKAERDGKAMKIEPNIGAGLGTDGDLSRRAMQEMQMLRDREREREEEERKNATIATTNAAAAAALASNKSTLGKRDRDRDRTGVGRHKDLDTPQEDPSFFPQPQAQAAGGVAGVKREANAPALGSGMKLALRRKKNVVSEQYSRSVYGIYWNAVQVKRAPVRDFDGRADEN